MKVISFTAFIAKSICVFFFLQSSAQAQVEQKEKLFFCFEVYDYIYLHNDRNSLENDALSQSSFEFLLEKANAKQVKNRKYLPLLVNFVEDQVIFYFHEPCSVSKGGFPEVIATHNQEFENKLSLVASQNYKTEDIECVLAEKFQPSCRAHLTINKKKRTRQRLNNR